MPVLAQVFGPDNSQLIFDLDIVDADSAITHQPLDEQVPQRHVLGSRAVGSTSGDVKSPSVIEVQRYAVKARAESQLLDHIRADHRLFHCQRCGYKLFLHRKLHCQPMQPHLKADRSVSQEDQVRGRLTVVWVVAPVCVRKRR